jgi:pyruvate kinase
MTQRPQSQALAGVRKAKIVCTLGPASNDAETVHALADAGMSVARLNASHGETGERRELIDLVREVDERTDRPIAIVLDLQGPEVRTGTVDEPVTLTSGGTVRFVPGETVTGDVVGLSTGIGATEPGDVVMLDDGRIEATVTDVSGDEVTATVDSGGDLGSRMGVNVPGVDLGLPMVTDADRAELDLAAAAGVDFVAASFVRTAEDVIEISAELEDRGADIPVIAKIERAGAVENLDAIIDAAYGIMVARGDLGVECPLEDVPMIQKRIIRRSHHAGRPVITATEMLDSMVRERRPTRAEASDVANAVLDGTDALMLSAETAVGDDPVRVVETMGRIVRDVEESDEYAELREQRVPPAADTRTDGLARSARFLARDLGATAIVAASESGYTARKAAKYRPSMPIVASTPTGTVRRQLALSWGIIPRHASLDEDSADALIQDAVRAALAADVAESGDTVVVLSGMMTELEGLDTANMLKVHVASETLSVGRSVVAGLVTGPLYPVEDGDLTDLPDGAILTVPEAFEGEFSGALSGIGGIVDAHGGMTGYAAILARELEIPMICHADLPVDAGAGRQVTLDAERGVLYAGDVASRERG